MVRCSNAALGAWLTLLTVLAACHLNHPRLWFQDLLCSVSLYWIPLIAFGFLLVSWSCIRARACSVALLYSLIVQGFLLYRVSSIAMPYLRYSAWAAVENAPGRDITMLFSHLDFAAGGFEKLAEEVARRSPGIAILVGQQQQLAQARDSFTDFPFSVESEPAGILVLSRFEPEEGSRNSLGIDALPGLFLKLRVPQAGTMLLGALDLIPAASQDDFFSSKVTSRRLATLMRYRKEPRVVAANFNATPFAPIVNMYPRQLGMRSVMSGTGLFRTFDLADPLVRLTLDNAFVSKNIVVSSFDTIGGISERRASFGWRLRILSGE